MILKYRNARGDELDLLNDDLFFVSNISGMTAFASSISSLVVGGVDGDFVNNIQGQPRGIIIDLQIKDKANVETAKRHILSVIKAKQSGRLIWSYSGRDMEIKGVAESVDMPRWTNEPIMQVSLHCEQPFWEDIEAIVQEIGSAIDMHWFTEDAQGMLYFPAEGIPLGEIDIYRNKSIFNDGDASVGMELVIHAIDIVTNPIIYNADGDFIGFGYGDGTKQLVMQPGDYLTITTEKGNKTATIDGVSVLDKLKPNSKWLQLEPGDNSFSINSDDVSVYNLYFAISYKRRYV